MVVMVIVVVIVMVITVMVVIVMMMVGVRTYLDTEDRQVVKPVQVLQLSDLIGAKEQTVQ